MLVLASLSQKRMEVVTSSKITEKSAHLQSRIKLPRIDDLLDILEDGKLFTKMDIIWGYSNICIKDGHEWKAPSSHQKDSSSQLSCILAFAIAWNLYAHDANNFP